MLILSFTEHEYQLDNITQSAQEFAKENLKRMKNKEIEEMKIHATIKRQEFEKQEKKRKEKEILDREFQMQKLEEEREQLKKDFQNHEEYQKEQHRYSLLILTFILAKFHLFYSGILENKC
jgi:hypothetical protein